MPEKLATNLPLRFFIPGAKSVRNFLLLLDRIMPTLCGIPRVATTSEGDVAANRVIRAPQSVRARREAGGLGDGESMAADRDPGGVSGPALMMPPAPVPAPASPATTPAAKPAQRLLRESV